MSYLGLLGWTAPQDPDPPFMSIDCAYCAYPDIPKQSRSLLNYHKPMAMQ